MTDLRWPPASDLVIGLSDAQAQTAVKVSIREFSFMQIGCLFGVMTAAAMAVHPAAAQEAGGKRVGIILQGGPWYAVVEGLREGLNQSGYVEGRQYVLDIRDTHGDLKAAEEAARNLEEHKVHLIYTAATSVSLAAKKATTRTPIVFYAGTDPVVVKLVDSIPRPGGRLTGVHNLRRVVTYYNPTNVAAVQSTTEAREATQKLGLELLERPVASVEELRNALRAFRSGEADAYLAAADAMLDTGSFGHRDAVG
jgi:putative tryptophan/tyrosine transport system substrate-binding protein